MTSRRPLLLLLALGGLVAWSACDRKRGEITGVGPYIVGETKLAQVGGACSPDRSQTWCTTLQALEVGKQSAAVDLYFDGREDTAPLVEVLLTIRACRPQSAASALTHELGKPDERLEQRLVWNFKRLVVVARLPASETTCEVSFVHVAKTRTIEYLKTGVMPPKPE